MNYLLKVQKAIAQTENVESAKIEYIEGWQQCAEDLTYAISLSEVATRQHIDFWTNSLVSILDEEDQGYCDRIDEIYKLIEEEGK
jgi:hypothetical protein